MRMEVERLVKHLFSAYTTNNDLAYTAFVMFVTLDEYLPTPEWVENVRVHFAGKTFMPRPDDDNAPDFFREGDADGQTLEIAITNALETAGCDRFGNDNF